ncbi:tail fiber assembly protein [Pseudomonas soli]|uniref:Tail fiber assembly protein n=1 Tax=Pseudomonas soli TaxID=1306993 RepID=A0ABU7GV14_9PSED|nr:tail fiber assembly protein [Pseudomonas soli]MEE1882858.1 tail fiber assembly protein [Pseudomonas soli]
MPYAVTGSVSSDPIEGGTEISFEQYEAAIQGMCDGLVVLVEDGQFSLAAPTEPDVELPTDDEMRAIAEALRDRLLAVATVRIAPLQDAIDFGKATDAENASLIAWKDFRIAVNRVDQQAGYPRDIDWPAEPV